VFWILKLKLEPLYGSSKLSPTILFGSLLTLNNVGFIFPETTSSPSLMMKLMQVLDNLPSQGSCLPDDYSRIEDKRNEMYFSSSDMDTVLDNKPPQKRKCKFANISICLCFFRGTFKSFVKKLNCLTNFKYL